MATLTAELNLRAAHLGCGSPTSTCAPRSKRARCSTRSCAATAIELRIGGPDTALTVRANAIRIEQVLVNLLKNAADAPGSRKRRFRASGLRRRPTSRAACTPCRHRQRPRHPARSARAAVRPSSRPNRSARGLGLGLSISYGIVQNLPAARSAPENLADGGACFTVELPLPAPQPLESAA